jgi:hypothetical protein
VIQVDTGPRRFEVSMAYFPHSIGQAFHATMAGMAAVYGNFGSGNESRLIRE